MKSQPVEFLEWVEHDLNYATDFYDSWLTDGANQFLTRFREAVTWIEWNPEQFPRKHRFFRRAIIRRTYFDQSERPVGTGVQGTVAVSYRDNDR